MRLIDADALKEGFKLGLASCNEWIATAKDKETKIRASAVKTFIGEVLITINNAPTVDTYTEDDVQCAIKEGHEVGYEMAKAKFERPQGEWIKHIRCIECSVCKDKFFADDEEENCQDYEPCTDLRFNYCPNCGAKMKKETEND